jgi:AraC family transcriptional regulator
LPAWKERRIKALMQADLAQQLPLRRLAAECGMSVRQFTRAFRSSTGCSPHRYLLTLRLARARQLLLDPGLRLDEVAMSCGFADQSHFTRVFGEVEKMSPGVWRRQRVARVGV